MGWKIIVAGNNSGGMYKFRRQLLSELVRRGCETVVLTPFDDMLEELRGLGVRLIETPVDRRGMNPFRDLKLYRQYRRILKRERPDALITYTVKPNIYACLAGKKLGKRRFANITGLGTAFEKDNWLLKLVCALYRRALRGTGRVFFENGTNRDVFVGRGIVSESQTAVLSGAGVDLDEFSPLPYPDDGDFRFLFIGRVMKEKGVDELLAAVSRLHGEDPRCSLDILGDLEEDFREKLERGAREGWLRYQGYQKDIRPFVRNCHCFVLPSWHEGMANTNLECAASARPVITSDVPGCREAVSAGISGFLCRSRDSGSLFEALKSFTELSAEDRCAMGLAGRSLMEKSFDRRLVVSQTLDFITNND